MVQKFVFDPRTLIDEEKENEKKKVAERPATGPLRLIGILATGLRKPKQPSV